MEQAQLWLLHWAGLSICCQYLPGLIMQYLLEWSLIDTYDNPPRCTPDALYICSNVSNPLMPLRAAVQASDLDCSVPVLLKSATKWPSVRDWNRAQTDMGPPLLGTWGVSSTYSFTLFTWLLIFSTLTLLPWPAVGFSCCFRFLTNIFFVSSAIL